MCRRFDPAPVHCFYLHRCKWLRNSTVWRAPIASHARPYGGEALSLGGRRLSRAQFVGRPRMTGVMATTRLGL